MGKKTTGIFYPYQWILDEREEEFTSIRIYGLDRNNNNTCLVVQDFKPYVYVEIPADTLWTDVNIIPLAKKIEELCKEKSPVSCDLKYMKKLYYASKKLFPFLQFRFQNVGDIRNLGYKLRNPIWCEGRQMKLFIHEQNATPILQLTSEKNLYPAGWITFSGTVNTEKITHCVNEYMVSANMLSPCLESVSPAIPLAMSFDLEVYSAVFSSMPKAHKETDKIFQCSCIFSRGKEIIKRILLTLGKLSSIDNVEIMEFKTEHELLLGFQKLVQKYQPNVILGYNIFGFDIPYMIDRAKLLVIMDEFDKLGMDIDGHGKEKSISWSSSAFKNQSFQFLDCEGRLFIDMLQLVKRDLKLSNYKLSTVAKHFLKNVEKDPLTAKDIFRAYEHGVLEKHRPSELLTTCGIYCVKDSVIVSELFKVMTTWIGLSEFSNVVNVPIFALYTQGQQLKVFSQVYKKCTNENIVVQKDGYIADEDDHYVGALVYTPKAGIYEKVLPFDFASLYPTTIIAYNLCWSTLVRDDDKIPDSECHLMEWEDHQGCPHDPKMIRKEELARTITKMMEETKELRRQRDLRANKDLKEEYKQKIAEMLLKIKPFRDEKSNLMKSKPKHVICKKRKFRWLKKPLGVLPSILKNLLDSRAAVKKQMKEIYGKEGMETLYDVLDQRQLALKTSANSGYGATGVVRGYLPCMPIAMCTTYKGRESITKAMHIICSEFKGQQVYSDTDSSYVNFPFLTTAEECWNYAGKVVEGVNSHFPPPMKIAFEDKIYWKFMILTKKRYMSLECKKDGKVSDKISKKGVVLQRRDSSNFVRNIYSTVVLMIFDGKSKNAIHDYILTEINKLFTCSLKLEDFIVTKSVGSMGTFEDANFEGKVELEDTINEKGKPCWKIGNYTVKKLPEGDCDKQFKLKGCDNRTDYYLHSLPSQAVLAYKMRKRGQLVQAGSRIEYVVTNNGGHTAKMYKKLESCDYFRNHSRSISIDFFYYLKQLVIPLDQVLDVIFVNDTGFVENQYTFRWKIREKCMNQLRNLFKPKVIFK